MRFPSRLIARGFVALLLAVRVSVSLPAQDVVLNEILASNRSIVLDEDGDSSDYIEIHNREDFAVDLEGWSLSNRVDGGRRWLFPRREIAPGGFVLVFASGKNRSPEAGELHTGFLLDSRGETLILFRPGAAGVEADAMRPFPVQRPDISWGRASDGTLRYLAEPTPREPNESAFFDGLVGDTTFSVDRGFFEAPFDLAITSSSPEAQIRYTLDGSEPSPTAGLLYGGPIRIERTRVVRAIAYREGWLSTNVDSQTYLFLDDVIRQSRATTIADGFPPSWGGTSADYGMDARVIGQDGTDNYNGVYAETIRDDLRAVPTVSIATEVDGLFGARGIYTNSQNRGIAWERACSVEIFDANGELEVQASCGLRVQGGAFRSHGLTKKHSWRLLFKGDYGPTKLRYPLFGDDAATEFDNLVLRANSNDGWQWADAGGQPLYIRDSFGRQTVLDMGGVASHELFVHVYLNGVYWGLYNLVERPDSSFSSSYFGGLRENWDAISNSEANDGDLRGWNAMRSRLGGVGNNDLYRAVQGLDPFGQPDPTLTNHVDVDNLIDYMITNLWVGNTDWPGKNYWIGWDRVEPKGFKYYMWDSEWSMNLRSPVGQSVVNVGTGVAEPYGRLRQNTEFRQRFGDRLHHHFSPEGTLYVDPDNPNWDPEHPERNRPAERFVKLAEQVESPLVAESARWGDQHRSPSYTREEHWRRELDTVLRGYLPQRSRIVLQQFQGAGLYPRVAAPSFTPRGGFVELGTRIVPRVNVGEIWLTTDGSDPRLFGGGVSETAELFGAGDRFVLLDQGATARAFVPSDDSLGRDWTQLEFDDSAWREGPTGVGFDTAETYREEIGLDVGDILYELQTSAYIRVPFDLDAELFEAGRSIFGLLLLRMKYDDGYVAYLNGVEIASANAPDEGVTWDSRSRTSHPDSAALQFEGVDVSEGLSLLRPGRNVLAIQGLNSRNTNNDFLITPRLEAVRDGAAIVIDRSTTLSTRTLDGADWSALERAAFWIDIPLRISELHYRPAPNPIVEGVPPGDMVNPEDLEFVEVQNIGDEPVDLRGVRLAGGITFDFTDGAVPTLAPGEAVVVVKSIVGFAARYDIGAVLVAGEYTGRLENRGEEILLLGPADEELVRFRYESDWYPETDGLGASLVVVDPGQPREAWGTPEGWRASDVMHGTPGVPERRVGGGARRLPSDVDGNGALDLADAVGLLELLFAGRGAESWPCPGAAANEDNRTLLDANGDLRLGITDAVHVLRYLFLAGPTPVLGTDCVEVGDCAEACE